MLSSKIHKLFFTIISLSIFLLLLIAALRLITSYFKVLPEEVNPESIYTDLMSIDYQRLLLLLITTLLVSFALNSIFYWVLVAVFDLDESKTLDFFRPFLKGSAAISVILPLTIVLSKEQFNVLTAYISFIALFSFLIPDDIRNKYKSKKLKKIKSNPHKRK